MAGCYNSNDPEDAYFERMLDNYLEQQDYEEELDDEYEEDYDPNYDNDEEF